MVGRDRGTENVIPRKKPPNTTPRKQWLAMATRCPSDVVRRRNVAKRSTAGKQKSLRNLVSGETLKF